MSAKKGNEGTGVAAWVMTFADLMTLLMCFFVLLLSFSEMDLLKFRQIAGSMEKAFGVQREIEEAKQSPKGTSIIAQEFSPGRPTPTVINEIRQSTIDDSRMTLEFTDAMTESEKKESSSPSEDFDGSGADAMQRNPKQEHTVTIGDEEIVDMADKMGSQNAEKIGELAEAAEESVAKTIAEIEETAQKPDTSTEELMGRQDQKKIAELEAAAATLAKKIAELEAAAKEAAQKPDTSTEKLTAQQKGIKEENVQTITDAYKLLKILEPEIEKGIVAIKTQGNRILLRINEKGSFPSGSSTVKDSFIPVLNKLRESLGEIEGRIIVAGHTDNVPIKNARFRSNWELSSSRAVTVVHELLDSDSDTLSQDRFVIEGHGDAHPMAPNDTSDNRAINRRVELTIVQGDYVDRVNEISADNANELNATYNVNEIPAVQDKNEAIELTTAQDEIIELTTEADNPFENKLESDDTPELTSSVQKILDEEIAPLDQTEIDAINLQTIKDRFEQIRNGLGLKDAHSMAPNDTPDNRAINRRVELTKVQGDYVDKVNETSAVKDEDENENVVNEVPIEPESPVEVSEEPSEPEDPFENELEGNDTPELTTSVQKILDEEIEPPDQTENDTGDLQTLKDRFEQIRNELDLMNQ